MRLLKILAFVLGLLVCTGCFYDPIIPVPPIPPVPPAPPVPPDPDSQVSRDVFVDVEVGGPSSQLESLPPPEKIVRVGDREIHVWVLDEKRPGDIGNVRWEIHVEEGEVVASFPF